MKKIFSTIAIVAAALVIICLIIIGVFLDHIVKKAIGVYGSKMTQTSVQVDTVHLSLLTGSAKIKGLIVDNPQGFKTDNAISMGTIAMGMNPMTVFSEKVVIRSIRLESPEITFEGGLGGNNLGQILDNVKSSGKSEETLSTNVAAQPESTKKYEVDDLVITGAKVHVLLTGMPEAQTITLPDIQLTDLGKGGEGITAADLTQRILSAISDKTVEAVSKNAGNLTKSSLKEIGQKAGSALSNAVENFLNKH